MGYRFYYRSTRPVTPAEASAIEQVTPELCRGRTWLSCEGVHYYGSKDGHLAGGSKTNPLPHPDDAADAAQDGRPDGTTRDALAILCRLSSDHGVDWEVSGDISGPVGYIRGGVCDDEVVSKIGSLADLGDILRDLGADEDA
jgi:hypothetical protein